MSLTHHVLGYPGGDNAVFVRLDSGQVIDRLMLDCGAGCFSKLPAGEAQEIDGLFFSHLHMDHVAGFDSFFRCNHGRTAKPNRIWGPPGTARILQHRFQGYMWNLHEDSQATWRVHDVHATHVEATRFELHEAFAIAHPEDSRPYDRVLWEGAAGHVEVMTLDHGIPSLGYLIREHTRHNIDPAQMAALGLRPGPWVKRIKESAGTEDTVEIDGALHRVDELRRALLTETRGQAVAYLTDFQVEEATLGPLAARLQGCQTLICEAQYRHADLELARKHRHMTAVLSATLAKEANVGELILIHVSSRYGRGEWGEMLEEACKVFPNTRYPEHWTGR